MITVYHRLSVRNENVALAPHPGSGPLDSDSPVPVLSLAVGERSFRRRPDADSV